MAAENRRRQHTAGRSQKESGTQAANKEEAGRPRSNSQHWRAERQGRAASAKEGPATKRGHPPVYSSLLPPLPPLPLWDWSRRGTKCYKMSLWEKIPLFMPTRRTRRCRASPAAARHRQPQQTPYLGESAETPESAATSLELLFSATTLRPAIFQQVPSATVILAQSAFRRLPRSVQHIPAPSPLAQASVRSPLTLQKERTRKLQVHMGLAASAIACLSPPDDR